MLKFTPEQERAVLSARAAYNQRETALASQAIMVGNAAPVPLDAWRRVDTRASMIQRDVLVVFNRLAAANTTPVGVGDILSYFPKISDSGEVHMSMDGRSDGKGDQALIKYEGTPVPVIDAVATWGWRQGEVIRKGGGVLDTESIANKQRRVAEKLEDMVINGASNINVAGNTVYGLRTFPNRTASTHGLTLTSSTGAQWLTMITQLINAHIADNAFGRLTIFLNWADYTAASLNEFAAGYPKTILQRLMEVEQIAEIVPASKVPANNVLSIAGMATGEWGSILSAMPLTTRPKFRANPEDDYVFTAMAVAAPQFRSDYSDRSQIVHLTQA
jgi:uncharacterized linocin/CFP29 family protein